jgi:hypothetical protein
LKAVGRLLCLFTHQISDLFRLERPGSIMIGLALLFLMVININNIFNNQIPLITSRNKKNDEQKREKGKVPYSFHPRRLLCCIKLRFLGKVEKASIRSDNSKDR